MNKIRGTCHDTFFPIKGFDAIIKHTEVSHVDASLMHLLGEGYPLVLLLMFSTAREILNFLIQPSCELRDSLLKHMGIGSGDVIIPLEPLGVVSLKRGEGVGVEGHRILGYQLRPQHPIQESALSRRGFAREDSRKICCGCCGEMRCVVVWWFNLFFKFEMIGSTVYKKNPVKGNTGSIEGWMFSSFSSKLKKNGERVSTHSRMQK